MTTARDQVRYRTIRSVAHQRMLTREVNVHLGRSGEETPRVGRTLTLEQ